MQYVLAALTNQYVIQAQNLTGLSKVCKEKMRNFYATFPLLVLNFHSITYELFYLFVKLRQKLVPIFGRIGMSKIRPHC